MNEEKIPAMKKAHAQFLKVCKAKNSNTDRVSCQLICDTGLRGWPSAEIFDGLTEALDGSLDPQFGGRDHRD